MIYAYKSPMPSLGKNHSNICVIPRVRLGEELSNLCVKIHVNKIEVYEKENEEGP